VAEIVDGDRYASGWIILVETELHLVGQVMVPDVAGWRLGAGA